MEFPKEIKLFTIKVPELDHLSADKRAETLAACIESHEFRRGTVIVRAIAFPIIVGLIVATLWFIKQIHPPGGILIGCFVCAFAVIGPVSVMFFAYPKILRRVVRRKLLEEYICNPVQPKKAQAPGGKV
jgi:hypothetical protein